MSPDATPAVKEVSREDGHLLLCPQCGYDLRGLNGNRCPECGREYDIASIVPTVNARVVDWFHANRRFTRTRAAWRAAWFPATAVSADAGRPALEGLGIALHAQVTLLHAVLLAGLIIAWQTVEHLMGVSEARLAGIIRLLPFSVIFQSTRVLLFLATSLVIAWAHFKLTDPARGTDEFVGLAGVIFCWTITAELLGDIAYLAWSQSIGRGITLSRLLGPDRHWQFGYYLDQIAWVLVPNLRYCLFGALICRGLRALPNRKWRATVLVPVLVCAVAAVIDDYMMRGITRLCQIIGLVSSG